MLLSLKLLKAPKAEILTRHNCRDANNILLIKKPVLQTPNMNSFLQQTENLCKPSCLKRVPPPPSQVPLNTTMAVPPSFRVLKTYSKPMNILRASIFFFPPKQQWLSHSYTELPWPLQEKQNSQQMKQPSVTNLSLPLKHPPSGIVGNSGTL